MGINTKHTQIKVSVDSDIAFAFKNACIASNISMAAVLTKHMADYSKSLVKPKGILDYSTRRRRRAVINGIIEQLEQMRTWEERVRDNTPENLQGSSAYDTTEEAVASLEEAIDVLTEFWMVP